MKIVHVVAAALVDGDGRVLLAQRPEGKSLAGLWEFPGGKLEPGESPETALVRELDEEQFSTRGSQLEQRLIRDNNISTKSSTTMMVPMPTLRAALKGVASPRVSSSFFPSRPNALATTSLASWSPLDHTSSLSLCSSDNRRLALAKSLLVVFWPRITGQ